MAKKRTGLQSEIAGIFSGVPVPKKGGKRSEADSPAQKPDSPASKPSGSVVPKPVTPQPRIPAAPMPKKIEEPRPVAPKPKVIEIKAPEQIAKRIPKKKSKRRKDQIFAPKSGVRSTKQKAEIILFVIFSMVLVIVLARQFLKPPGNPDPARTPGTPGNKNSTKAEIKIDWPIPPVYSADIRDPMLKGSQQIIVKQSELEVVGISWSEDRKFATIGTQTVQEGDIVEGTKIRVKKINPNSVEFEEDGKTWIQKTRERQKIENGRKIM